MALCHELDSSKDEFRLIRFVGEYPELSWELASFSLHDGPSWVALSYCWGKSEATETMIVNGEDFPVRPNLYAFLDQMACENRRDWFFIDAICINQADMAERASQVSLMGQIYGKAQEVIAWVTPDDQVLERYGVPKARIGLMRPLQRTDEPNPTAGEVFTSEEYQSLGTFLKTLVLNSNYWSRLWIVQEILLARFLTIRCYFFTFAWSDVVVGEPHRKATRYVDLDHNGRPLRPNGFVVRNCGMELVIFR